MSGEARLQTCRRGAKTGACILLCSSATPSPGQTLPILYLNSLQETTSGATISPTLQIRRGKLGMPETQTQAVHDTLPSTPTNSSVPLKCKDSGGGGGGYRSISQWKGTNIKFLYQASGSHPKVTLTPREHQIISGSTMLLLRALLKPEMVTQDSSLHQRTTWIKVSSVFRLRY